MNSSSTSVMFSPSAAVTDLKVLCSLTGTFREIPKPWSATEQLPATPRRDHLQLPAIRGH